VVAYVECHKHPHTLAARGLTEAMSGTLTPEDTPGGGLTMVLSSPAA
jgi:hypothetical protein